MDELDWQLTGHKSMQIGGCQNVGVQVCVGSPHHDAVVNEATAVAGRAEMGVLLSAGRLDAPHRFPGLIELRVDGVHTRVVGGHSIPQIRGNPMLLGTA